MKSFVTQHLRQRYAMAAVKVAFIVAFIAAMVISSASPVYSQWRPANLPVGYDGGYYLDVFFLPSNPLYGWVSGFDGKVLRTTDGGTTWRGAIVPGANGDILESINFVSRLVGFASGRSGIFKSTDGGVTWQTVTPPGTTSLWGCYFVNANVGMVVGGFCGGQQEFFRTIDGGQSWSVFAGNAPDTKLADVMLYSPDGLGYASSSGYVWRTDDGGKSWVILSQTGSHVWQEEITNIGSSILVPTSGTDCDGQGRTAGEMRFSTDEGNTWRRFQTGRSMFGAFLNSPTSGWGVGDNSTVIHTVDAGRTWQSVNCGMPSGVNIDDVYFINDTTGWCVGQGVYQFIPVKGEPISIQSGTLRFCEGDSVPLTASGGYDRYHWSTGETTQGILARKGGTYYVTGYMDAICYISTDSIVVTSLPAPTPALQTNRTPVLCQPDDSVIISAPAGFRSYRWSTGETGRSIIVKTFGSFTLTVTDSNGCTGISQTIVVKKSDPFKPNITASRNPTICAGDSVRLIADDGYASYLWNTGETTRSITAKKAGSYRVTVRDANGCDGTSDEITVTVLDLQNRIVIGNIEPGQIEFSLDTSGLGILGCKALTIRNRDVVNTVVIEQPILLHNILFSLKQKELPLVIPPSSVANLTICFAPVDTGLFRDTLVLADTCSPNYIPLRGYGAPLNIGGKSQCQIQVTGIIFSLGKNFRASEPYPNPSNGEFTVAYEIDGIAQPKSARLLTMLGSSVGEVIWNTATISQGRESGNLLVKTPGLPAGTYILALASGSDAIAIPVVIE